MCGLGPEELGPFLLGHLGPEESARVRLLARGCPECNADIRMLGPVVEALSLARPLAVDGPEDVTADRATGMPAGVLDRVLRAVERERRSSRRRWTLVAAAALVVSIVVTGGAVFALRAHGERVLLAGPGIGRGTAVLVEQGYGTSIALDVSGLQPGGTYGAWLARPDGRRLPAGSFRAGVDGRASVRLSVALPLRDAAVAGVTRLGGEDVMTVDLPARH